MPNLYSRALSHWPEHIPWLLHEVLIKDTAAVIKTTQSFMHFPPHLTSGKSHNLAICASLLICATIYCTCYTFYHQHLYYVNVPGDVRRSFACPCWFKVLQSNSILCLQAWIGRASGSFRRHFMGGRAGMKCVRSMSFWHHYFQRPMSLSSKNWNPERILTASFSLESYSNHWLFFFYCPTALPKRNQ